MDANTKYSYSFTKFHSKELFRALRVLNPREFITYLTLGRLINYKRNYRRLSMSELLKEIPLSMSERTLSRCIKTLLDKMFIKRFISPETGHNVFSLVKIATSYGYSKVDNEIITNIAKKIDNAIEFKVYFLIFSMNELFNKASEPKRLREITKFLGMPTTKSSRDTISKAIKKLEDKKLIETKTTQQKFFFERKYTFILPTSWRNKNSDSEHTTENTPDEAKADTVVSQKTDCFKEDKKDFGLKSNLKSKNLEAESQADQENQINNKPSETLNFNNFNFYGLDKLPNPLHIKTIISISKTTELNLEQIQRSVKRFSEYINSCYYDSRYPSPIPLLCKHLRKNGEYVPPEGYLQNSHKEEDKPISKEDYQDVVNIALNFVASESSENDLGLQLGEEVSPSRGENLKLRERARRELEGIFPKANLRSQAKMVKQLCERYMDSAMNLVKQNIPITIENLSNSNLLLTGKLYTKGEMKV